MAVMLRRLRHVAAPRQQVLSSCSESHSSRHVVPKPYRESRTAAAPDTLFRSTSVLRPVTIADCFDVSVNNAPRPFYGSSRRRLSTLSTRDVEANKDTHPAEWAIFSSVDLDRDGFINLQELSKMCRDLEVPEHSDKLFEILDGSAAHDGAMTFQEFCKKFAAVVELRSAARLRVWNRCFGLGVAGNVAGHMTQAGEADAPTDASAAAPSTPAAVFAFYVPNQDDPTSNDDDDYSALESWRGAEAFESWRGADSWESWREGGGSWRGAESWQGAQSWRTAEESLEDAQNADKAEKRLQRFPVTNSIIYYPHLEGAGNVQVEPEMGVYVEVLYRRDGKSVDRLIPRKVAAFNDCSIRALDGSTKLSEKTNWGHGSKGISLQSIKVDSFAPGTLVDRLVLVSYVKRDQEIHKYSINANARTYLMFYEPLLNWIVDKLNNQQDADKWENMAQLISKAGYPDRMWIALGAGGYTEWGEKNFLLPRDETVVMIYNEQTFPDGPSNDEVRSMFEDAPAPAGVIALHQTFV